MSRLMGVLESTGNVYVNITENKNYKSGYLITPGYRIIKKNTTMLISISELLFENGIESHIHKTELTVRRIHSLNNLVNYTSNFAFKNEVKEKQFIILKTFIDILNKKKSDTSCGMEECFRLKRELDIL